VHSLVSILEIILDLNYLFGCLVCEVAFSYLQRNSSLLPSFARIH
jgi:hypothetical protein